MVYGWALPAPKTRMNQTTAPEPAGFLGKFTVLKGAARELWLTFLLKFLICAAYYITYLSLSRWLLVDHHWRDVSVTPMVTAWAVTMTIVTLLVGSLTDALGMRRTFLLGVWICLFARAIMVFANTSAAFILVAGVFPLAIGEALGTPVLIAATRKYSTTAQRSISFSIIYAVMNLGLLAGNYVIDWVRKALGGESGHWTLPFIGWEITTYRTLFLVSFIIELLALVTLFFLREGVEVTDDKVQITPHAAHQATSAWNTIRVSARDTTRFLGELIRQRGFYRLLLFLLLISFLKVVFSVMGIVFPTWCVRVLGDQVPYGHLSGINNWLVIILVPLIGAFTQRYAAYRMVILGGVITAASLFIMALPTVWFQPAANSWLGSGFGHIFLGVQGAIHPYYIMTALFIIGVSFGEAFYSPRVYEYAAAIAPKGKEASYGSLSYIPFLFAKLLTGAFGGLLLAKYSPEHGERHSGILWLYVALTATIAPIGLILLQSRIRVHEAGRPDNAQPAAAKNK